MKKTLIATVALMLTFVGFGAVVVSADATGGSQSTPCDVPTVVVTDSPAYDETIPGEAEVWANFSPNKQNKKFVGPPAWPNDPRGTWQVHNKIPGGHVGPDGVYQKGNGNASWFYRHVGTPDTVVHHEAVTHTEANPNYPCVTETPTDPTTEPTDPVTSEPPVTEPPVDTEFITPNWSISVDCLKPLRDWIIVNSTKQYDVEVTETGGHQFEIVFRIVAGDFEFATGNGYEVAENGKSAVAYVMLPVVRCVPPKEPQVPEVETRCSPKKCVKITRDSSGKVTGREVENFGNVKEEGL